MTNTDLLRERIDESGYRLRYIADRMGMSYAVFLKRVYGTTEFKQSEIERLSAILKLSKRDRNDIFFPDFVGNTPTKA